MTKPIAEFRCSLCQTPNAQWGISGVEYCSICMPRDAVKALVANMSPAGAMKMKKTLKAAGNKALNGETS